MQVCDKHIQCSCDNLACVYFMYNDLCTVDR